MTSPPPRLLLAEDDAVSAAFMREALAAMPAEVVAVARFADARAALSVERFDVWLFDAHLPDGEAATQLPALRAAFDGVAVAHTASREKAVLDALIAAGFVEVLIKPLSARELQAAVRRHLGALPAPAPATRGKLPVWDDAQAERALGDADHVRALRELFRTELPAARAAIDAAAEAGDEAALRAHLHRLRASCGFVGAARMGAAVERLAGAPADPAALQVFRDAVEDTLATPGMPG